MAKESFSLKRYKEELKEMTWIVMRYRSMNQYHEFVFDAKQESQRMFIGWAFVSVFVQLFLGVWIDVFIYSALGSLLIIFLYLLWDRIFLSQWRKAIILLKRSGGKK